MRPSLAFTAATLIIVSASLVGCAEDQPAAAPEVTAVCSSVDELKTSMSDLKDVDLTTADTLTDLESALAAVKGNLDDVKKEAKLEFAPQIAAADATYEALKTSLGAAKADPSAASLAAVGTAITTFSADVETLVDDIGATC